MTQPRNRSGFTIIELLAVVGIVGVGASLSNVAINAGNTSAPAAVRQPDDKQKKDIEKIRKELDEIKKKIGQIEGQLDSIEKGGDKDAKKDDKGKTGLTGARAQARQLKDATQIRGIDQSFVIWANQNKGVYPLPSTLDKAGTTIAGDAATKDTTANIISILIFNGYISTELCISPAEANPNIKICDNYMYDQPAKAKTPASALWDPAFNADFTNGKTGSVSYAHLQPAGKRLAKWADTFITTEACVSNRGPEITSIDNAANGSQTAKTKLDKSITYLIHGDKETWEGNVGYNDGHVQFETSLVGMPKADDPFPTYKTKEGKTFRDCLFFDEPGEAEPTTNLYLGIFTKAGKDVADWSAIWD